MKQLIVFLLLATTLPAFTQNDSITFASAKWESTPIAKGITLQHYHFTNKSLFNSNQNITIVEVKMKGRNKMAFGYEPQVLKTTSTFGKEANAIAAINATFFDVKNGGSVDYLEINDSVISTNRLLKNGDRARHQQAAMLIKKGRLSIAKWDSTANWESTLKAKDIMCSGPLLLLHKQVELLDTGEFNRVRHPRSALALVSKKKVLLITVDGRAENAAGMSLYELTKVVQWLQAKDALNLDGGGSTTLWLQSQGVVNYPSDNKKWDHEGERKVANTVLVTRP